MFTVCAVLQVGDEGAGRAEAGLGLTTEKEEVGSVVATDEDDADGVWEARSAG